MLCSRGVLWALCLISVPAFAQTPVSCPASISVAGQKHNLAEIDVFDGPPKDMYNLVPNNSGGSSFWDTTFRYSSDGGFYVECIFDGTGVAQIVPIPHDVTKCILGGSAKAEQIFCR
jgi:hypothetical protein